mmetsp:Transcript_34726/g.63096  ORF Transcript_34726/g.63096 Transcript_34726/m.63096 type:complete len:422 (-) Transcript_34726:30-1295(-)
MRSSRRLVQTSRGVRSKSSLASLSDRTPVIVSFARTPIGKFNGALAPLSGTKLGAAAVKGAFERAGLNVEADGALVDEVFMGNVVSAGMGQAPATQAVVFAGLPKSIPSTTVHKVCASGMKSAMFAADAIALGRAEIIIAGGMESMSNIPHYVPAMRTGVRLGEAKIVDGMVQDGLWDVYSQIHMGSCAEMAAEKYGIGREAQDTFAAGSYEKALSKSALELAAEQIVPVEVPAGRGKTVMVEADEEPPAGNLAKMPSLRPAFKKDGTVTAANASKLNDGAAAMVIMSAAEARKRGAKALAAIRSFADAQQEPEWFTTAPSLAVPKAVARAGLVASDVTVHEVNEAFSVVALANAQILGLDLATVNVHGGAVAMGHPIGTSGARIMGQLCHVMREKGATFGSASICNGGGGASAIILELLE